MPVAEACPACRQLGADELLYRKNGCDIHRCRRCGLGRAETTTFDPERYYNEGYFSGEQADGYADYLGAEDVLRREFVRTVEFLGRFVSAGRLLEIGCAYGFFLREAASRYDVSGIELAADAAAHCRSLGLDVTTGVADEAALAKVGMVDAIVMLDVLEHLPAPHDTVALCLRHLNPGGVLLITTGDFGSVLARLTGPRWRLMTPPQHLWFFSAESIRRLAESLRLEVELFDHPWKLVPVSLVTFQLRRMLKLRPPARIKKSRLGLPINLFDAMRVVLRKA